MINDLTLKDPTSGSPRKTYLRRIKLYFAILLCALVSAAPTLVSPIIVLGVLIQLAVSITFLVVSLKTRTSLKYEKYWQVFYALFISSVIVLLRTAVIGFFATFGTTLSSELLIGVSDFVVTVGVIVSFTKLSGKNLSSIYLKRGNLKLGVKAGFSSFFVLIIGIILAFEFLYGNSHGISVERLLSLLPFLLGAAALNAPKEELWFRGLILGKIQPILGLSLSNLLQAPLFMLAHFETQYAQFGEIFFLSFLMLTFIAGLGFGYLMQKSNSLIGSSIARAGADVGVFLLLFSPILLQA